MLDIRGGADVCVLLIAATGTTDAGGGSGQHADDGVRRVGRTRRARWRRGAGGQTWCADYDYDLFVIGARLGRRARRRASRPATAPGSPSRRSTAFGGTCVIRGCVPKKLLVYASRFRRRVRGRAGFGWTVGEADVRLADADRRQGQGDRAPRSGSIATALGSAGVDDRSRARDGHRGRNAVRLASAGRDASRADKILIATGGQPWLAEPKSRAASTPSPPTRLSIWHELPSSIVIVGGGYIAVEFAGIFARLGVETTLVYRGDKILRGFDEDLRDRVCRSLCRSAASASSRSAPSRDREDRRTACAGALSATARRSRPSRSCSRSAARPTRPASASTRPASSSAGTAHVVVDEYSQLRRSTASTPSATSPTASTLTPVAIREGHAFADTEFGGKPRIDRSRR